MPEPPPIPGPSPRRPPFGPVPPFPSGPPIIRKPHDGERVITLQDGSRLLDGTAICPVMSLVASDIQMCIPCMPIASGKIKYVLETGSLNGMTQLIYDGVNHWLSPVVATFRAWVGSFGTGCINEQPPNDVRWGLIFNPLGWRLVLGNHPLGDMTTFFVVYLPPRGLGSQRINDRQRDECCLGGPYQNENTACNYPLFKAGYNGIVTLECT